MAVNNAAIITRFPEFTDTDTDLIDLAIAEAERNVDDTWLEADRDNAVKYLTAHILAIGGHGTGGLNPSGGMVSAEKLGDASVSYAVDAAASSDYASTSYGRQFQRLLRLNHPGVVTV